MGLLAILLCGCGDVGATEEERQQAYRRGLEVGQGEANREAGLRVQLARETAGRKGYRRGKADGWSEGWDDAEAALEGAEEGGDLGGQLNPYPIKKNGEPSYEFEPDDIERAEEAPESVREYCEGAVSEAQEIGCLSHVNPWEVP